MNFGIGQWLRWWNVSRPERIEVYESAEILPGKGVPSVIGGLHDISPTGARITVYEDVSLSGKVRIRIPEYGVETTARICWRRGRAVGVKFDDRIELKQKTSRARLDRKDVVCSQLGGAVGELHARINEMATSNDILSGNPKS
ncbi:MAG: PilZ domain-containing protein [Alphaproteobacteria bacterium]